MGMKNEFFLSPLEGFLACDVDEASSPKYYGFQNVFGGWIIMEDTTGVIRYAYGSKDQGSGNDYETKWIARATLTYGLPVDVFTELQ